MKQKSEQKMEVFGSLILGYAQACINLKYIAGDEAHNLIKDVQVAGWYPLDLFKNLGDIVSGAYDDPGPILERVGEEMMLGWYAMGPGKDIINKGHEFLSFQAGSEGYQSVVKGPKELIGEFFLEMIDVEKGVARVHSTTPFQKDMERGVIIGGMKAPGDLSYIDVSNDEDKHYFDIHFS
ncbi:MAG: hypothetical protein GY754_29640 [bacterium]|nr:hypothetical protein [bacterium]